MVHIYTHRYATLVFIFFKDIDVKDLHIFIEKDCISFYYHNRRSFSSSPGHFYLKFTNRTGMTPFPKGFFLQLGLFFCCAGASRCVPAILPEGTSVW